MKILELFAGSKSISKEFEKRDHEIYTVDWDESLPGIDWYADISKITAEDILERFGKPDVIWASPDCTTYSIAGIYNHREKEADGNLKPKSEKAEMSDRVNIHMLNLIEELNPVLFFIENPRGGLRKMEFMQGIPRYTVTYCQYGDNRMKPTDIWTNHPDPNFKPMCKNGDPCHERAPRGSATGTQGRNGWLERSKIPSGLGSHIVDISEQYIENRK